MLRPGRSEVCELVYDEQPSLKSKAAGIAGAVIKSLIAIIILFGADYAVAYAMYFCKMNYRQYPGVFYVASSVIALVILYFFAKLEGEYTTLKANSKTNSSGNNVNPELSNKKPNLIRFSNPGGMGIIAGCVIAFALIGFVSLYMYIADILSTYEEAISEAYEKYTEQVEVYKPAIVYPVWDQLLYAFSITFLVPIAEEFTFRGIIYGAFNRRLNAAWSIIISSTIFGLLHGVSIHIGYALVSGVVMGLAYYAFDSIAVPIVIHGVFNLFGSAVYIVADALKISRTTLPNIFTLEFMMMIPAALLLGYKISERRRINREAMMFVPEDAANTEDEAITENTATTSEGSDE